MYLCMYVCILDPFLSDKWFWRVLPDSAWHRSFSTLQMIVGLLVFLSWLWLRCLRSGLAVWLLLLCKSIISLDFRMPHAPRREESISGFHTHKKLHAPRGDLIRDTVDPLGRWKGWQTDSRLKRLLACPLDGHRDWRRCMKQACLDAGECFTSSLFVRLIHPDKVLRLFLGSSIFQHTATFTWQWRQEWSISYTFIHRLEIKQNMN